MRKFCIVLLSNCFRARGPRRGQNDLERDLEDLAFVPSRKFNGEFVINRVCDVFINNSVITVIYSNKVVTFLPV